MKPPRSRVRTLLVAVAAVAVALYASAVLRGLALDAAKRPGLALFTVAFATVPGLIGWLVGRADRRRHAYSIRLQYYQEIRSDLTRSRPDGDVAESEARRTYNRRLGWVVRMERKYERASRYPWFPVAPDPPPPE
jgi:hypothetical protein